MADEEKFDAVVVGAGPAGSAAAITMAKAGLQVALLERGQKPGAMVVPETVVDRLIVKNNRVVGVATGRGDDLYAEVVVVCEGIGLGTGLLEKTAINGQPLRRKLRPNEVAMAAKEIMQLEPRLIEERFNCEPGEGCTIECFGDSTMGMSGFMFIYTNKDTLSVGGGALLSEFNERLNSPHDLLEHFKT